MIQDTLRYNIEFELFSSPWITFFLPLLTTKFILLFYINISISFLSLRLKNEKLRVTERKNQ